jgi:cytoskeleton protein RodZ
VGSLLRQAREQRGQDIESVARALRIRYPYLVAIEESRYSDLPGAPYASGFVRSYAEYLGLDATEMLRRFREESGGMGGRTELVFPAPVSEGGFPAAILIGMVIIIAAIVYGVWYFYQWRHNSTAESVSVLPDRLAALIHAPGGEDQPASTPTGAQAATQPTTPIQQTRPAATPQAAATTATAAPAQTPQPATPPAATTAMTPAPVQPAPAPAQASAPAAAPATTPPPATPTATAPAAPQPASQPTQVAKAEPEATPPAAPAATPTASAPPAPDLGTPSRVVLRANEDCWIEIRDSSGAVITSRLMHKGDAFPVPPKPGLTLTVGNAGALTMLLDGNPLPPLGKTGMVRHDVPLDADRMSSPAAANPAPAPANGDNPNN